MLSARNQLKVSVLEVKTGVVNSLITAKFSNDGEVLKSVITIDSEKNLDLKPGKEAFFIFKASNVIIASPDSLDLKISATNQIKSTVKEIKDGSVNSEVILDVHGSEIISIITKESVKNMNLKVGDKVVAIIKASNVIVATK